MRIPRLLVLLWLGVVGSALADEKFAVLQVGSDTYTNVTVTDVTATDIFFTHAGGMANAKIKQLSPELQKHFDYNSDRAKAVEFKQAQNAAQYHQALLRQPSPPPAVAETTTTESAVWREDFAGAMNQARSERKLVLLNFTGSDWCPWCIKFDHDVLATPRFAAYAADKLELVRLDFPDHTPQSDDLRRANAELKARFAVDGFPTYILLDDSGKELGRQVGYRAGGPDGFIAELDGFGRH